MNHARGMATFYYGAEHDEVAMVRIRIRRRAAELTGVKIAS